MSLASQLNDKQLEAMKYTQGPLLVLAGAGSGKTSVITRKIAYLVKHCGIPAHRITAMTFTNKAAREMKERVTKLMSREEAKGLSVSTFHTFGLNLLRLELKNTPLKANFSILDADDCKRILMDLMHRDNLSGAESKELIARAMKMISDWKNDLIPPEQAHTTCETPEDVQMAHLYQLYERNLRAYNAVDFDDLIVMPTRLLQENLEVRERWQNRIRYLLVDEYQDTNTAQYILVKLLVGVMGQFTAVGDDDQSIYAWRGAKPENMALLQEDFRNLKVIKLEQNYRSTSRILKAANTVIGKAKPDCWFKESLLVLGWSHPIKGFSNSKERFFIISAYKPPSAAKLMSSKNKPNIVGWILVIVLVTSTSKVVFCALA